MKIDEKEKNRKKLKYISAYETFALADVEKRDPVTNLTTPSIEAVEEAKDWVDFLKL
jgi:hypothetical protein